LNVSAEFDDVVVSDGSPASATPTPTRGTAPGPTPIPGSGPTGWAAVNYLGQNGDNANIYSEANYFYNTKDAFAAYDDSSHPGFVEDVNCLFEGNNGAAQDNPPTGHWAWNPAQYYSNVPHTAAWVKANLKNYAGVGKPTIPNKYYYQKAISYGIAFLRMHCDFI
jgi:hypothetical protein